jgi:deazaflavin-dependent oxidoreductase (nitroreductase family)
MVSRIGSTRLGVWLIKHLVSPTQRWLYRATGGKGFTTKASGRDVLLLTTRGRRTGKERTTPVFYLRDGDRVVICNVNPGFERPNPWVLNLRAHPVARLQIGPDTAEYRAREATEAEVGLYWPQLIRIWPAYQAHFEKSHQRAVFVLERT